MSLSTIITDLETGVSKGIGDLRNIAQAVDQNPIVQAALGVADEVAPEVKAAVSALLPELTGVSVQEIDGVFAAFKLVLAGAKAGPQPAAAPAQ